MSDPRDPRQGGDDQPLLPPPPGPPPPEPEPELTERYGPVAPEPAWRLLDEKNEGLQLRLQKRQHFNRERFLLRCVAWIIGVQFGVFILAAGACTYAYYLKARLIIKADQQATVCPGMVERIRQSAGESLAVLLALLGGGTIALNEAERRRQDDPREGDRLPPPR